MSADRPYLGVTLMLGFCALIPISDGIAKLLGGVLPLVMLLLARFAIQAAVLVPIIVATGRDLRMTPRLWWLTLWRAVLQCAALAALFAALRHLPLADAIAIIFVMPFLMLLFGHLILGEIVGLPRLAACAAGFVGTLMVVQPNFAEVGAPALLPLLVALCYAAFMLITRQAARQADALVLQATSGALALILLAVLLAVGPDHPDLRLVWPEAGHAAMLGLMGVIGTLAHLAMTVALRFAPAATLAPMQYLEIPFSTFVGWVMFRDLPDGLAAFGIAVTIAAGLAIIARERALARRVPARAPGAPPAGE